MRKLIVIMAMLSTLFCNSLYAEDVCTKESGVMYCTQGVIDKVHFFGNVIMNGTTVLNKTYVFGNLDADNVQLGSVNATGNVSVRSGTINQFIAILGNTTMFGSTTLGNTDITGNFNGENFKSKSLIKIIGDVYCKDCYFAAATKFIGNLKMRNTEFITTIELVTESSSFFHSKLQNILIKNGNKETSQEIILDDNSEVHDITFENQKGIVKLSRNSRITGIVTGGIVKTI